MAADDESINGSFAQRVDLILEQRQLHDAMRVLNDEAHDGGLAANTLLILDAFRDHLNTAVVARRDAGNDEQQILQDLRRLSVRALVDTLNLWNEQRERVRQSGFTEVASIPAPAAAAAAAAVVISLEKQTFFRAAGGENDDDDDGVTECSICFEEFVDGEQVSVMPCPSHGHKFHPDCIAKWLEIRSTCSLCRHELPTCCSGSN